LIILAVNTKGLKKLVCDVKIPGGISRTTFTQSFDQGQARMGF